MSRIDADYLEFSLRPSLLKILARVAVFATLFYLLQKNVEPIFALILLTFCIVIAFFLRQKIYITKFSHLDKNEWTLQDQYKDNHRQYLSHIHDAGFIIFLYFETENDEKNLSFCVFQDQLSAQEWTRLKRLAKYE